MDPATYRCIHVPSNKPPHRFDVKPGQPRGQLLDQLSHLVDANDIDKVSPTPAELLHPGVRFYSPFLLDPEPGLKGSKQMHSDVTTMSAILVTCICTGHLLSRACKKGNAPVPSVPREVFSDIITGK